ncbi:MAG: hypothetical protein MK160_02495 [Rhodobacteraceae bacterium]|nr:hypothetical protein [Paracoccaceae bacterium]
MNRITPAGTQGAMPKKLGDTPGAHPMVTEHPQGTSNNGLDRLYLGQIACRRRINITGEPNTGDSGVSPVAKDFTSRT